MAFAETGVLPLKTLVRFGRKLFTGPAIALHWVGMFGQWRWVVCVPIQAVTARWHHDSGNEVQDDPLKPGAFCLFWRVCYQPRTWSGFGNLSVNWGQVSPKCRLRFEQNGLSSRWQGGIYDLGWKPSEHLTCNQADLGCGYAWRVCVYWNKISGQGSGNMSLPEPKPEGVCTTLLWTALRRFHMTSLLTQGGSRREPRSSIQMWSAVAPLPF